MIWNLEYLVFSGRSTFGIKQRKRSPTSACFNLCSVYTLDVISNLFCLQVTNLCNLFINQSGVTHVMFLSCWCVNKASSRVRIHLSFLEVKRFNASKRSPVRSGQCALSYKFQLHWFPIQIRVRPDQQHSSIDGRHVDLLSIHSCIEPFQRPLLTYQSIICPHNLWPSVVGLLEEPRCSTAWAVLVHSLFPSPSNEIDCPYLSDPWTLFHLKTHYSSICIQTPGYLNTLHLATSWFLCNILFCIVLLSYWLQIQEPPLSHVTKSCDAYVVKGVALKKSWDKITQHLSNTSLRLFWSIFI